MTSAEEMQGLSAFFCFIESSSYKAKTLREDAHDVHRKAAKVARTSARKVEQVPQGFREFEADLSALFWNCIRNRSGYVSMYFTVAILFHNKT